MITLTTTNLTIIVTGAILLGWLVGAGMGICATMSAMDKAFKKRGF